MPARLLNPIDLGQFTSVVPIGGIIGWNKSLAGTPALSRSFVECNGQVLNDPESPLHGETIPELNTSNSMLYGNATSGSTTAKTTAHTHTIKVNNDSTNAVVSTTGANFDKSFIATNASPAGSYSVVWIIRVK